jgi:hypothetical protein
MFKFEQKSKSENFEQTQNLNKFGPASKKLKIKSKSKSKKKQKRKGKRKKQ